jgi:hypothetical protein
VLVSGPSARRTENLLKLNGENFRLVFGLFTGHCHPKGHLVKMGLTDDPTCERCLEDESATHMLCDCETIAYLKFRHLSQFLMEPKVKEIKLVIKALSETCVSFVVLECI